MKTKDGREVHIMPNGDIYTRVTPCKSCSFYNRQSQPKGYGICQVLGRMMKDGEFCCYGKERNDAD